MFKVGIMQGRLSHKPGAPLQSFPYQTWREEFDVAAETGLNHIEWLVDRLDDPRNPINSSAGLSRIKSALYNSGVRVSSSCFHFVLDDHWQNLPTHLKRESVGRLFESLEYCGCEVVCWPLQNPDSTDVDVVNSLMRHTSIRVAFEVNSGIRKFSESILSTKNSVGIVFDTGNVWAESVNYFEELHSAFPTLSEVHLKDKDRITGISKSLGDGDTPLIQTFTFLQSMQWDGLYTLETPILDNYAGELARNLRYLKSNVTDLSGI